MQHLQGKPTSTIFRNPATGEWIPARAALHENIIADLLAGNSGKKNPTLWVVTGGVGSGKSTLIRSELAPEHSEAVVIDADQMWLKIPEYEALAAEDWKTAGERTYTEVRYLRDATLPRRQHGD
jgi:adenylylsulfate kinase-like enzyme